MARRRVAGGAALLLLLVAVPLVGCVAPSGTTPGPDNPQLVLFRTEDLALQMVVKGAFKDREYDRIQVASDGDTVATQNHTYLVSHKLNATTFNLSVRVHLGRSVYVYDAAFTVLANGLRVTEAQADGPGRTDTRDFPFTKILEKAPEGNA